MNTIQKWLTFMFILGAGALVASKPDSFAKFFGGVRNVVGGTEADIINAGTK